MIRVLALCCVMVLTPGCDKKESEASKTGEASNTGSAEGAAPPASFDVGTLGLTGDAPAGTKARSMGKKVMVQGTGLVASVGMAARGAPRPAPATADHRLSGGWRRSRCA